MKKGSAGAAIPVSVAEPSGGEAEFSIAVEAAERRDFLAKTVPAFAVPIYRTLVRGWQRS
jgi:hypothetical protein